MYKITESADNYEIRSITPRESFVVQGMTMEDCDKAHAVGVSNSQLYKQAGNGLTSNVVTLIFEHLYKAFWDSDYECYDEKMIAEGHGVGNEAEVIEEEVEGQMTLWGLLDDQRNV